MEPQGQPDDNGGSRSLIAGRRKPTNKKSYATGVLGLLLVTGASAAVWYVFFRQAPAPSGDGPADTAPNTTLTASGQTPEQATEGAQETAAEEAETVEEANEGAQETETAAEEAETVEEVVEHTVSESGASEEHGSSSGTLVLFCDEVDGDSGTKLEIEEEQTVESFGVTAEAVCARDAGFTGLSADALGMRDTELEWRDAAASKKWESPGSGDTKLGKLFGSASSPQMHLRYTTNRPKTALAGVLTAGLGYLTLGLIKKNGAQGKVAREQAEALARDFKLGQQAAPMSPPFKVDAPLPTKAPPTIDELVKAFEVIQAMDRKPEEMKNGAPPTQEDLKEALAVLEADKAQGPRSLTGSDVGLAAWLPVAAVAVMLAACGLRAVRRRSRRVAGRPQPSHVLELGAR